MSGVLVAGKRSAMMTRGARATMAANGGLLTWAQARDAGLTTASIRALLRAKRLIWLCRGVYVDADLWDTLAESERHQLRTRAAISRMERGYVVSHDSAGYEHGLEMLVPPVSFVHITRRGSTAAWTRGGVKRHYAPFAPGQAVERNGLEVLDLARTAVDIAREHGEPYGEVACDSAIRLGVPKSMLVDAYLPMVSWPHKQRVVRAVDFARAGAESVAETLGRLLVEELGIGAVELQFPVFRPDGRVAWCDIRVGCHIFEVDGKVKITPTGLGGLATEPAHEVVWKQQKRARDLGSRGLGTSSIIWQDFWSPHREPALRRLRAEYDETVSRRGTVLPADLRREAAEIRARWAARRAG